MGKQRVGLLVVLAALLFSGNGQAQVSAAAISGTVQDTSGAVLPGATVVVLNQDTGISRTVQTNLSGHYRVLSLSSGSNYRVTATAQGFQTVVRTGIVLTVGREEVVDIALPVGSMEQSVEVTSRPPLVEATTGSLGNLVAGESIRGLPLNGRSYDQLAQLQPNVLMTNPGTDGGSAFSWGTGQKISVAGQRPNSNVFLLDGTNINDQANGTPGGAAGTNLGVDTIQEFRIITSAFKAEYGHSSGSVVTAVTRTGTNDFHGSVFYYHRNSALDAWNYFDVSRKPPFKRNQFGGVLGGPIKKDKTFFFAGYEGLRQGLGRTQFATVPTAAARMGILPSGNVTVNPAVVPYLDLYPLPNGRDFGDGSGQFVSQPTVVTNQDNIMGRVDHHFNEAHRVFGRYTFDDDETDSPTNLPFFSNQLASRRQYYTGQWDYVVSARTLNNFRFAYNRNYSVLARAYTSQITPALAFVQGPQMGILQVGAVLAAGTTRSIQPLGHANAENIWAFRTIQFSDDLSVLLNRHSIKMGVDVQRMRDDFQTGTRVRGEYTFPTFARFLQGLPSRFRVANNPVGEVWLNLFRQTLIAVYVQDDWQVNSRFTLNLGLRWEATTDATDDRGVAAQLPSPGAPAAVAADTYYTTPKKNFEPRLGFAWRVTESGKTVVRGGAGIYHNQILPYVYQHYARIPAPPGNFGAEAVVSNPAFPDPGSIAAVTARALTIMYPRVMTPTAYHYNLSIQQQLSPSNVLQLSYTGNTGTYLLSQREGNPAISVICPDVSCPAGVPDGERFIPAGSPRQNPNFDGIRLFDTNARSRYDGVTVEFRNDSWASRGFTGQVFYSFQKAMDNSSSVSESIRSSPAVMIPQDIGRDWGLSDYHQSHSLIGYLTYRPPFRVQSRALGAVVNGWTINTIAQYRTGMPFTPLLATSRSGDLSTADLAERPNLNPGFSSNPTSGVSAGCPGFAAGTPVGTPRNWFDPCAYSRPLAGTYGNSTRNALIGPNFHTVDLGLQKIFNATERIDVEFRAELFNALNHPNFSVPNPTALRSDGTANASAGVITGTVSSARQLQFSLRISF